MADVEMVERVARAIYASRNGPGAKPWSLLPKAHKSPYLDDARAAIEALREPTEEMERAGDETGCFVASDEDVSYRGREAGNVYRAMIDRALGKEGD